MADDSAQPKKLNPKQEAFVLAYIGGDDHGRHKFNATWAAKRAGYSEKTAYSIGSELLKKPDIVARVQDLLTAWAMPAQGVLAELTEIASAEWKEFVEILTWDDAGKPLKVKMDLGSKVKSLELLGKHHQLFSDNLNINGGIEIREIVGVPDETP